MASSKPISRTKSLSAVSNLSNLLPTGTVLAFQAILPSLSENGACLAAHKYLTLSAIVCCSVVCFFSSFTDSFVGTNGKLYYGIAVYRNLYILNKDDDDGGDEEIKGDEDIEDGDKGKNKKKKPSLEDFGIEFRDFVHAFVSLLVFLVFATGSSVVVQSCFFPHPGPNTKALMANLPLVVGAAASFVFMILPTKRRGIGYGDMAASTRSIPKKGNADTALEPISKNNRDVSAAPPKA